MKRIWFAMAFFAILVFCSVGEQVYVKNVYSNLNTLICVAQSQPNTENTNAIKQYWNKNNAILFALFDHNNLDNLAIEIRSLDCKNDDFDSQLKNVKASNIVFYQNLRVTLENIF